MKQTARRPSPDEGEGEGRLNFAHQSGNREIKQVQEQYTKTDQELINQSR